MHDQECIEFLRWALPRLGLRWRGFRKVRRQVCRRIQDRIRALGLSGVTSYRALLAWQTEEWRHLSGCCVITISRFYRDQGVYQGLAEKVLPVLAARRAAAREDSLRVWSAGCASGEEPYSLVFVWSMLMAGRFPGMDLDIVATDSQSELLARARRACYRRSSLRELPASWSDKGFVVRGDEWCMKDHFRQGVRFLRHDVADEPPPGTFDLVLCRNLVFTYFTPERQQQFLRQLIPRLADGAALVVGAHEALPPGRRGFSAWPGASCTWCFDPADR